MEVVEINEEYTIVRVRLSEELYERVNERGALAEHVFLAPADEFVVHEDEGTVSLKVPEVSTFSTPAEVECLDEATYRMHFRTADIDFSEVEDEEVTLGFGVFPERTVPRDQFDTVSLPNTLVDSADPTDPDLQ